MAQNPDDINVDIWISFLVETTLLFKQMGSAISMAFADIPVKIEAIRKSKDIFQRETGKERVTIQEIIEWELQQKLEKINGDNNRKELKGKQLGSNDFRLTYTSTARNVGKTRWVLEFFSIMMGRLYEDREAKLSAVALEAYNKVLGPYSSWVIRQGAYIAIQTVPSRESFLKDTKTDYSQIK